MKLNDHVAVLVRVEQSLADASRLLSERDGLDLRQVLQIVGTATEADCAYFVSVEGVGDWGIASRGAQVEVWHRDGAAAEWAWRAERATWLEKNLACTVQEGLWATPFGGNGAPGGSAVRGAAAPVFSAARVLLGFVGVEGGWVQGRGARQRPRVLDILSSVLALYFERERALEARLASERRWHRLVDGHPEAILVVAGGRIGYANPAAALLLGCRPEAHALYDFLSAEHHGWMQHHMAMLLAEGDNDGRMKLAFDLIRLDGAVRHMEAVLTPVTYWDQPAVQFALRDVTEQRVAEDRYRHFISTIAEGIWLVRLERPISTDTFPSLQVRHLCETGRLAECNAVMAGFLAAPGRSELLGQNPSVLVPRWEALVEAFVQARYRLQNYEYTLRLPGQAERHFIVNATGQLERGRLVYIWGSCIDISERIALEQRMVAALEQQQERIGRDLHDGLGQLLTGMRMMAENLAEQHLSHDQEAYCQARRVVEFAGEAARALRELHRGLAPTRLVDGALTTALADLAHDVDALPGVQCSFVGHDREGRWPHELRLQLYRIAQEAVNNALKHAQAHNILISLKHDAEQLTLQVCDDGRGFSHPGGIPDALGLYSMQYRARSLGARLDVASRPGVGTTVTCHLPRTPGRRQR